MIWAAEGTPEFLLLRLAFQKTLEDCDLIPGDLVDLVQAAIAYGRSL